MDRERVAFALCNTCLYAKDHTFRWLSSACGDYLYVADHKCNLWIQSALSCPHT